MCIILQKIGIRSRRGRGGSKAGIQPLVGSRDPRRFHWPAWSQPLDSAGIDALMDAWIPERRATWRRVGVHAGCQRTEDGSPTRRSKIRYFLARRDMAAESLEEFVEDDIENIVQLFSVFNKGTHGVAGTFDLPQLGAVRKRVENGIMFLLEIIGDA